MIDEIYLLAENDKHTQHSINTNSMHTQTDNKTGHAPSILPSEVDLNQISSLCDVLRNSVEKWSHKSERTFSTFLFLILCCAQTLCLSQHTVSAHQFSTCSQHFIIFPIPLNLHLSLIVFNLVIVSF